MTGRLRREEGYSVVELLVVMVILTTVLTALSSVFVSGANAELDMNRRFEAQQGARVALDKLRREIHCASSAATTPATGQAPMVTLTLPSQCPTGNGAVSWCTVNVAASPAEGEALMAEAWPQEDDLSYQAQVFGT